MAWQVADCVIIVVVWTSFNPVGKGTKGVRCCDETNKRTATKGGKN